MVFKEIEKTSKYCKFCCGTMWHYIYVLFFLQKIRQKMVFKEIGKTFKILTIWLWHYVALYLCIVFCKK